MRVIGWVAVAALLAWPVWAGAGDGAGKEGAGMDRQRMSLEMRVGGEVYRQAGLAKLTPQEQMALAEWIKDYGDRMAAAAEASCRRDQEQKPRP